MRFWSYFHAIFHAVNSCQFESNVPVALYFIRDQFAPIQAASGAGFRKTATI